MRNYLLARSQMMKRIEQKDMHGLKAGQSRGTQ